MSTTDYWTSWPRERLHTWSRDWSRVVLFGCGLYVLVYVLWLFFPWGNPAYRVLISDVACLPPIGIATVLAWRSSRIAHVTQNTRRAWKFFAVAFLCLLLGDLLWFYYEIILGVEPFPSWADPVYLLFYPLIMAGLLSLSAASGTRTTRIKFWLDALAVLLGGGMAMWYFIIHPLVQAEYATWLETILGLAYPLGDLVLLFGITITLLQMRNEGNRQALRILVVGLVIFLIADLSYTYLDLQGLYESGDWPDALWSITYFLMAQSGYAQSRPLTNGSSRPPLLVYRSGFRFLPYLAVALGYGLLLFVARNVWADVLGELILGAVVLTAVVVVRQALADQDARQSEARFRSLVQNASDVVTVLDPDAMILYESSAVERILGFQPHSRIGTSGLEHLHPDDQDAAQACFEEALEEQGGFCTTEVRARHTDHSWRWIELNFTNLLHDPNVRGVVANYRDISERKKLEAQLKHQAFHDPLTDLANRVLFQQQMEQALSHQQQRGPVALLLLDVDGFKTINDSLGHAMGDRVLVAVSERLRACSRESKIVARLGGDEFALLLENVQQTSDATHMAEQVIRALGKPLNIQGKELFVHGSVGIAISTDAHEDANELLRNADVAMYAAKHRGKGRFAVFAPSMHAAALSRLELEADLRHAIEQREFVVHYQPIVSLETGAILAMEALVRWQHPQRGLISPASFIPLAEETGLILPIGQLVLLQACRDAQAWQSTSPNDPSPIVSVNLSARQLQSPSLVADITQALQETKLDPTMLQLEITESVAMEHAEATIKTLQQLKELGIHLAIDDFGTGYSSLAYLQRFPIDSLKVDRSFVQQLGQHPEDTAIVRAITTLAQALNLVVTGEGIETAEQAAFLHTLGCSRGQGYYFAKPLPNAAAGVLLMKSTLYPSLP